ncbi:MAG: 30S ribosomal protein S4 [Candidatus Eisenbacteria bacterium]|uniref:Small ribosomal subunit protein uS4 n=1 Tax=Eiseniibacteriota bacterium TaxID=2212470 RepID=A0A948RV86_UNCEI|nr:30S ribosomal protein S4 [Candidatus Eisenbacteria bacterium]MBU1950613.1 30S ribosomal protein S4 [Candidatus Eisenbacteria bacterium]MBU2691146.1 30S ribosomal protein S4 [Candidatus Eisenbacteria bacterium]
MARYRDARCRLCRREGIRLYLKGERCYSDKCAVESRGFPPGQHGRGRRTRETSYGLQLREKQKAKRIYGILERQFRRYFQIASMRQGRAGEELLKILESRLDNVVHRLGMVPSRSYARQLVRHRHIEVNGRVVTIPSYQVRSGDLVSVREKSKLRKEIKETMENRRRTEDQPWLDVMDKEVAGKVLQLPSRDEVKIPVNEQMIVELYSK